MVIIGFLGFRGPGTSIGQSGSGDGRYKQDYIVVIIRRRLLDVLLK